jgi:hypothetical protein
MMDYLLRERFWQFGNLMFPRAVLIDISTGIVGIVRHRYKVGINPSLRIPRPLPVVDQELENGFTY